MNLIVRVKTNFENADELISRIQHVSEANPFIIQAFNPDSIVSENHLIFSARHAFKAFAEGRNIADRIENEILLRTAATRRIDEAIKRVGVKDPKDILLFISGKRIYEKGILKQLDAEKIGLKFGNESEIAKKFGLEKNENYSLEDLLLEKIALLELEK